MDVTDEMRECLAQLHERAREQNSHLPQYRGYWDGWGLAEMASRDGLRESAPQVGERLLIEPASPGAEYRSVYSPATRSNWILPVTAVDALIEPISR